jgi:hypothetical protein
MTVKWSVEMLAMGSASDVNNRLYRRRKPHQVISIRN